MKMLEIVTEDPNGMSDFWRPDGPGGFHSLHLADIQSEVRRRRLRRDGYVVALCLAIFKSGSTISPYLLLVILGERDALTDLDLLRRTMGEDDAVYRQLCILPSNRQDTIPAEHVQSVKQLMMEALPNEMVRRNRPRLPRDAYSPLAIESVSLRE
jgi:hypothetical protein